MTATITAPPPRIRLRPHQSKAVHAAHTALRLTARTSVVMACGTGKTYVAARLARRLAPQGTRLVLLPTLELLAQAIDDWRTAGMTGSVLALCSKRPNPASESVAFTTDPAVLAATVHQNPVGLTVFATYHSLHRVQEAHHHFALPAWSLVAIDEAHRTSGDLGKRWAAVHDDELIPAHKRAYFTATPRIWSAGEPGDDEDDSLVASMDNPTLYGDTCFRLPLAEAIDIDLLADYRVVVMEVNEATIRTRLGISDKATEAELRQAALQIAVLRAMAELDLRRVVSFHHRVADAHAFAGTLRETAARLYDLDETGTSCPDPGELWATGLDGNQDPAYRRELLDRFDGRPGEFIESAHRTLIANARLLGEGVNIPSIDTVVFADPKESIVDTVQAVGRALRQKPGQGKKATLIVPVYVAPGEDADDLMGSNLYRPLWRVLQALRAHDDRIADRLAIPQQPSSQQPEDEPEETSVPVDVVFDRPFPADTIAQAFRLRVLHPREANFRRGLEAAAAYQQTHGHLDVPQLHDDADGFALGRWINRARKAYAAGTLKPAQIKALEHLGIIWNLQTQAAERGLLHARNWAAKHGHLAVPTDETIGDYAFGRWLTNRRAAARTRAENELEADPTDTALAEIDPYWNPAWPIAWQRLYYTARTYAEASITLDDLPADFITDDDEPLGAWVRAQSTEYGTLHPEQLQLVGELGITLIEPAEEEPPPTGRAARQQRQLDQGLAAVAAFRDREGHVNIRQRDTVTVDGEEVKVGQWIKNLRKRWDTLPPEHLHAVTEAGLTPHPPQPTPQADAPAAT
ncbi:DEAD/DEAH box helicase family protein [Streptomyces sp. CJ_13]|uniref:DEAD/DEAH box helicase n=1 Tax=Streptomyces sp. CJ_13 TaxID=2724943 RepID=UPI001BDDB46A|nr:DEAD/DEAH box helicase [Streptomyces sp. CJ_13]MBT1186766.1 DEAD/DEAH box helicase family protein [Streptomyces sp. CJ_13]